MDPRAENEHGTAANAPVLAAAAALALGALALGAWFRDAAVPDPRTHRMFLVVWTVGGLLLAGDLAGRRGIGGAPRLLSPLHRVYVGLLAGIAVGTTVWSQPGPAFWHQLWWSGPITVALLLASWRCRRP
ncbi:hypothetical protein FHX37_0107 [Haloactinospora alba]|uniref:Uncharacterized protein n=1 Tax=Haloactinospora alba TaxID=405555 RepID=A0A543NEJ7_9ACTN|nr:hypothetical protein [Haloactinospora alba]TQN30245.1 hypothetical protein FHX37_0107 [Haloactinospora alba]